LETLNVDKNVERPAKKIKTDNADSKPTIVVNPFTPFRRADGTIRERSWTSHESSPSHLLSPIDPNVSFEQPPESPTNEVDEDTTEADNPPPQIFAHLNIYVNGSTAPLISDHKLKHILTSHGAGISIALGRRTVTHVIIGRPSSKGGSGGGLSGSKLHKEVTRKGGSAVKYVTVEWVLESVKAGRRQPESKFATLSVAPKGVASIASIFESSWKKEEDGMEQDDGG
jgi:hypothetical protein